MLPSPADFHAIVSGQRRGLAAAAARAGLAVAEWPYSWAVRWRNRRFDSGARPIQRAGVPVVSIGNLTLGGTGKTPLAAWLARWFRARGIRVTLISRGYGAEAGARNDEALELENLLPDVPHVQNPDRVAAARMAIREFEAQLLLLDDAFQHRRIHRDLDLVLLDAVEPFGFEHVFPRGLLREPLAGLKRADAIILSRADMVDAARRAEIRQRAAQFNPKALWVEATHNASGLLNADDPPDGGLHALDELRGKRMAAFCGLGNPRGFRHTLETCGYQVVGFREFPDHHAYGRDDLESLAGWAASLDAAAAVCTHKDLVKLGIGRLGDCPLYALTIGIAFTQGQQALEERLEGVAKTILTASSRPDN